MKNSITVLIILFSISLKSQNQPEIEKDSIYPLDEVIIKGNTILGNKFVAKNRSPIGTLVLGNYQLGNAISQYPGARPNIHALMHHFKPTRRAQLFLQKELTAEYQ